MAEVVNCPRCRKPLTASEQAPETLVCDDCGGSFVPRADDDETSTEPEATVVSKEKPLPDSDATALGCPVCAFTMLADHVADAVLYRCETCGGIWADAVESDESPQGLRRQLLYTLTLPERVLRSTVGVTAGAAKEAAEFLVPSAFQTSKTYEVVVRNSLRFLTEDVGGVAGDAEAEDLGKDFAARKAVGNFVDLAGWATLAFSPVWMMAVVSDVAYGSKTYIRELAEELKAKGLIDENSTINSVDDVLEAVQNATGHAASLVDTPPLSVEQLKESLNETRAAVASADYMSVLPEAEIKKYWGEMREIATREDVSLIGVSGGLTMHTLGKLGTVARGGLTGLTVAGGLFNKNVLGHYVESMKAVREVGFYETVSETSGPYVEAVWGNFAAKKSTLTEEVVTGRLVGKAFRAIKGFFTRPKPDETPK